LLLHTAGRNYTGFIYLRDNNFIIELNADKKDENMRITFPVNKQHNTIKKEKITCLYMNIGDGNPMAGKLVMIREKDKMEVTLKDSVQFFKEDDEQLDWLQKNNIIKEITNNFVSL